MSGRGEFKRADRVGDRIRVEITELLMRGAVRDPGTAGVIISAVKVTDDLGLARIYIRLLDPESSEEVRERAVRAMERASGYLRRELGQRLRLQRTPALEFYWDGTIDEALRVEALLKEISDEKS